MLREYARLTLTDIPSVISTSWTDRVFDDSFDIFAAKRVYKPVDRKHRPVLTYMPNPEAQQFKTIQPPTPLNLPTHPIPYQQLKFSKRVTLERLESMLAKIEPGILTSQEIDLLSFVVVAHEEAFAFCYAEKGSFKREIYPDYEIPTIEHVPWQRPPIRIPFALKEQ
ncbi:hypothetical protein K435DRAFT_702988, partial [Dendrothele bispora CBS 962.96]